MKCQGMQAGICHRNVETIYPRRVECKSCVVDDPDLTKNGGILLLAMIHKDEEHGSSDGALREYVELLPKTSAEPLLTFRRRFGGRILRDGLGSRNGRDSAGRHRDVTLHRATARRGGSPVSTSQR